MSRGGLALVLFALTACGGVPEELQPDEVLRAELGLSDADEVHRITVLGGETESAAPATVVVPRGAWVEFFSGDWRVHEVSFEVDSLTAEAARFLQQTDQVSSPPLVNQGARFVVSFSEAPAGRYPFVLAGNGGPTRGVVVVRDRR